MIFWRSPKLPRAGDSAKERPEFCIKTDAHGKTRSLTVWMPNEP